MRIFDHLNYKDFVKAWISSRPKSGHGELRKLAMSLRTSSTVISQVFNGDRELTMEQALDACTYFQLDELEKEYFLLLVQINRSGSEALQNYYRDQANKVRKKSTDLKSRLKHTPILGDEDRAIFYSHWLYSAVRNLSALPNLKSMEEIADHLKVNRKVIKGVVEFLLSRELCVGKESDLNVGPSRTHLESNTLMTSRHHINWRQKAMENYERLNPEEEISFTFPVSLSKKSTIQIREEIIEFISKINNTVVSSESEQCACLNIDWFRF